MKNLTTQAKITMMTTMKNKKKSFFALHLNWRLSVSVRCNKRQINIHTDVNSIKNHYAQFVCLIFRK